MKKNTTRKVILFSIIGLFVISSLVKLNIEPSDYSKSIYKEVIKANKLIDKAVIGNDNGEYSNNEIKKLRNSISISQNTVDSDSSTVEEEKEVFNSLKNDIKAFKKAQNKNSISKGEVEKIKEDDEEVIKEIKLDDTSTIKWTIKGKTVKEASPINLDTSSESVNKEKILELLSNKSVDKYLISFRHNGAFPGFISMNLENNNDFKEAFLYSYNEESNSLSYSTDVAVSEGKLMFSVNEGGDYIITDKKIETLDKENSEESKGNEESKDNNSELAENVDGTSSDNESKNPSNGDKTSKPNGAAPPSNDNTSSDKNNNESKPKSKTCTIEIRYDTILKNMDKLRPGLDKYVPNNGVILATTTVEIYDGENVFDILKRVTRNKKIQMEFRNDPVYSGAYIEGINHLYEFDCGTESGWMYKVNGWFPNYGCSQYKVKDGDVISWVYTCDLGKDVGDQYYDK